MYSKMPTEFFFRDLDGQLDHIQNLFYVIIQPTVECECKERICVCMVPYTPFPLIWYAAWPWGGSAGKIFATTLLHLWFPLIWYATRPCSEQVDFWPQGQRGGERGFAAKIFACCLFRDSILKDFRNAPVIYSLSLPHGWFEDVFFIIFYPLMQWTMICHSFDMLMRFILT